METNGVDVERVEAEARAVLASVAEYVWDGESLPVPVDDIVADEFGLLVRLVEDLSTAPGCEKLPPEKLSGLLLTGPGEIWVSAAEARRWDGRRRFTISHELGHYVMHQKAMGHEAAPRIFCRSIVEGGQSDAAESETGLADGEGVESGSAREKRPDGDLIGGAQSALELEANAFAAALMMPRHLVVEQYNRHGDDVGLLSSTFGSSGKAMRYRLEAMKTWG